MNTALKIEPKVEIKNQPKGVLKIALKGLGWLVGGYVVVLVCACLAGAFHGAFMSEPVQYTIVEHQ